MKSIASRFLLVLLSLCLIAGIVFGVYLFTKDDETTEISSAAKVIGTISDKLEEVSNTFAEMATESSAGASNNSISALDIGFANGDISSYLRRNYYASRIVFASSYLAENTNTENGYANGFEFNKVYAGIAEIDGYSGQVYLSSSTTSDGVYLYFDFVTDANYTFIVTLYADYDFENDICNSIKMNFLMMPYITEIWAAEYDFVNNNFKCVYAREYEVRHTTDDTEEILNLYNSGTFTAEQAFDYNWDEIMIISGNITTDITLLNYSALEYSIYTSGSVSDASAILLYNYVYNSLYSLPLRSMDELIVTDTDYIFVSYIADCVNYGWNKAEYNIYTLNNRTYYFFSFIEYEDLVEYLTEIQTTIYADGTANNNVKELIDASISFLQSRGKARYTGTIDEATYYNGLLISFAKNSYGIFDFDGTSKPAPIYQLKDSSTGAYIEFTIYNGSVRNLNYSS